MKNPFVSLLNFLSSLAARSSVKKKPQPPIHCSFCGEAGHEEKDCPKAAKYKLFNVDRE